MPIHENIGESPRMSENPSGATQGFVCVTLGRPSHCSNLAEMTCTQESSRFRLSACSVAEDKLLDRALKLLKKAISEKQTRLESGGSRWLECFGCTWMLCDSFAPSIQQASHVAPQKVDSIILLLDTELQGIVSFENC